MSAISADRFTFIVFGFASFVATLGIEKERETRRNKRDKGDKADKASGRWTHHPTKGNKKEDKLRRETKPREGGHTIQPREIRRSRRKTSWETS